MPAHCQGPEGRPGPGHAATDFTVFRRNRCDYLNKGACPDKCDWQNSKLTIYFPVPFLSLPPFGGVLFILGNYPSHACSVSTKQLRLLFYPQPIFKHCRIPCLTRVNCRSRKDVPAVHKPKRPGPVTHPVDAQASHRSPGRWEPGTCSLARVTAGTRTGPTSECDVTRQIASVAAAVLLAVKCHRRHSEFAPAGFRLRGLP